MRFYSGIEVDGEEALKRANLILAGIKGGAKQAVGSALSRAASSGKTEVKKFVTEEYTLSQSTFLQETKNINHYQRSSDGGISVVFGFRGNVIPLTKFSTSVGKNGHVEVQVKRSSSKTSLDHAFAGTMGSHKGIFERIGAERFPVRELYGPATTQMIYSNEAVLDKMEDKMLEVFNTRVDHEINRILNGWGR